MFDVGFAELCIITLVALLVIGPERLPKAARLTGFWLGKMRHLVASVKEEIKQELHAEEMRQILKEQADLQEEFSDLAIGETKQLLKEADDSLKSAVDPSAVNNAESHEQQ